MEELYLPEKNIYVRKNTFQEGKETIIFIHGLAGSSSAWRKYEDALRDTYNIISYDLRGHGKSTRYEYFEDYHFSNFTDDLGYLVEHFSLDKFVLVAHSFGTFVAIDYLLKHGDHVRRCILLAPGFDASARLLIPFINIGITTTKLARKMFDIEPKMSHVEYVPHLQAGDWNIRRMVADIHNTGLLVYLYCIKQAMGVTYRQRLQTVSCPTLIVHGKKDSVLRYSRSVNIHHSLGNSELVLLPDANHVLVFNHFDEIVERMSHFINN